jgi:hypothetical protein
MFQYYAEDTDRFTRTRDLTLVRQLNPELQSFRDWLAARKNEIPRALAIVKPVGQGVTQGFLGALLCARIPGAARRGLPAGECPPEETGVDFHY